MVPIVIGVSWCFVGLLIAALAVPLARRKVPPNSVYGGRFRASFQSEEAWYAINRYAATRMIAWSIPIVLLGAALLTLRPTLTAATALLLGFAPVLFVLIPTFQTYRFATRYAPPPGPEHGG